MPSSVPIYQGDPSQLLTLPVDALKSKKIVGLNETPHDLNFTSKLLKDERIKKQLLNLSGLLPEMAIFSLQDQIPGIVGARVPRVPYGPQTNVVIASRKTLYLYRFQMILQNITEYAILDELKARFISLYKLNPADKGQYKVTVFERRLTIRMHNSYKELIRP